MKTKQFLKTLLLLTLSALLVIGAVSCDFGKITTDNGVKISKKASASEFLEAVIENTSLEYEDELTKKLAAFAEKLEEKGSAELNAAISQLGNVTAYITFDDSNVTFKANVNGIAEALAFINKDELAVSVTANAGGADISGAYGISLKDLKENLKNSIFAPGSGSAYELPEAQYKEIESALDSLDLEGMTDISNDLEKLLNSMLDDAKAKFELTKVDNSDKTYEIKCQITPKDAVEYIKSCAAKLDENKTVADFIKKYAGTVIPDGSSFSDLVKDLEDNINEDAKPLNLSVHVTEDYLVDKLTVAEEGKEDEAFVIAIKKVDGGFELAVTAEKETATVSYTYKDGAAKYSMKAGGAEIVFDWNYGKDGAYTVKITGGGQDAELKGTMTLADDKLEIKVNEIDGDSLGDSDVNLDVAVVISTAVDESKAAKKFEYKDILKLTEEEATSIISFISGIIGGGDAPTTPDTGDEPFTFSSEWVGTELGIPEPEFGEGLLITDTLDEESDIMYLYDEITEDAATAYTTALESSSFKFLEEESTTIGAVVYEINENLHLIFGNQDGAGFLILTARDLNTVFEDYSFVPEK